MFVFTLTSQCTDLFRVNRFQWTSCLCPLFLEKQAKAEACSLHVQKHAFTLVKPVCGPIVLALRALSRHFECSQLRNLPHDLLVLLDNSRRFNIQSGVKVCKWITGKSQQCWLKTVTNSRGMVSYIEKSSNPHFVVRNQRNILASNDTTCRRF